MCIFCDGAIYYMLKIVTTEIAARDSVHATNITHAAHPGERNHARYNRALVILRNLRTRYWFAFTIIGFIFTTNFYSHIFARVGTRQHSVWFLTRQLANKHLVNPPHRAPVRHIYAH